MALHVASRNTDCSKVTRKNVSASSSRGAFRRATNHVQFSVHLRKIKSPRNRCVWIATFTSFMCAEFACLHSARLTSDSIARAQEEHG